MRHAFPAALRGALVACLMLVATVALVALPAHAAPEETAAIRDVLQRKIGTNPAEGYYLVDALRRWRHDADATNLRRYLDQHYAAALRGTPHDPAVTVAQAITRAPAKAKANHAVLESAIVSKLVFALPTAGTIDVRREAWRKHETLPRALGDDGILWDSETAPGVWLGNKQVWWAMSVTNSSTLPVPVNALALKFGTDDVRCQIVADEDVVIAAGAHRSFVCRVPVTQRDSVMRAITGPPEGFARAITSVRMAEGIATSHLRDVSKTNYDALLEEYDSCENRGDCRKGDSRLRNLLLAAFGGGFAGFLLLAALFGGRPAGAFVGTVVVLVIGAWLAWQFGVENGSSGGLEILVIWMIGAWLLMAAMAGVGVGWLVLAYWHVRRRRDSA